MHYRQIGYLAKRRQRLSCMGGKMTTRTDRDKVFSERFYAWEKTANAMQKLLVWAAEDKDHEWGLESWQDRYDCKLYVSPYGRRASESAPTLAEAIEKALRTGRKRIAITAMSSRQKTLGGTKAKDIVENASIVEKESGE